MDKILIGKASRRFKFKKIFTYFIDGDYYLISRTVCRKCEPDEIPLAQETIAEVKKILSSQKERTLYEKDVTKFKELYQQLQIKDLSIESLSENHTKGAIEALLRSAPDANNLNDQLNDLEAVLNLIDEIKICGKAVKW